MTKHKMLPWITVLTLLPFLWACSPAERSTHVPPEATPEIETSPIEATPTESKAATPKAGVLTVEVSGDPGAYTFSVEIRSPDLGCNQYADWWEVIDEEGGLVYRRILTHSHVNEQPFTRSGGPVPIAAETVVWVRAHMVPSGYGDVAFKGSVLNGFQQTDLSPDFASGLAETPPLPDGCAF